MSDQVDPGIAIEYVRACRTLEDAGMRASGFDILYVAGSEPWKALPRPELCADRAVHGVPNGGHCFDCHRHPPGPRRCHFCGVAQPWI